MHLALALSLLSLAVWLVLIFARAGFWRVRKPAAAPDPAAWPEVVAVIPARNEADVIGRAVAGVLGQRYRGRLALVVVDDHSQDGTADIARAAAAATARPRGLTVIGARELPAGWSGKVWAQSEGLAAADGIAPQARYVWLTDADIWHGPGVLAGLVARAEHERRDLVSLMVRLRCESAWERLIVPAFVFFFAKLYPFARVRDARCRVAAAAGGCMLASRAALARIGGFAAIRGELIDDCGLAARIKPGGAIRLDLADDSVSLRPYNDWRSLWDMIARSAYTQLRYSPPLLAGAVAGMVLTYLVPPVLALGWRLWPAWLAWGAMTLAYLPMLREYRQPAWLAPLLPVTALFYLGATIDSARRYWLRRGGQWKGRAQAPVRS
ncbi:Glycosyltransferase, catalytic subunit of cellulose synthase and poly-beta-1,6-N-acetylglucosamine synthase [Cupriavidus necator]|uniref:Glycosyl transferase n=1 Tax=Cupriavidus necator (strain ATCC 17699 / DSM 428 / KCTC 22496 / NCIMB 10442 / H16 / Stanier 337) TaxID=381666 RepID=Q0JZ75_CUPNH|nr:glycosyltransferase [Cupriavidus necator]QCC04738.1 glycosyltransferase [Cupriavidus necator H16]QQB79431.1 glycosyltransferase [Cupriavidus necator]WKA43662.1 glycosyltransferase [Cupriavidus necator]CAJ96949.1 glycosyl transferase [Cupriavidus necator H16]